MNFQAFQQLYQEVKKDDPKLFDAMNRIHDCLKDLYAEANKLDERLKKLGG